MIPAELQEVANILGLAFVVCGVGLVFRILFVLLGWDKE